MSTLPREPASGIKGAFSEGAPATAGSSGLPRDPESGTKGALSRGAPSAPDAAGASLAGPQAATRHREPVPKQLGLLLGIKAIAQFLGVSKGHARRLVKRRAFPTFRLDGQDCALRSSIFAHLKMLEAAHGERS